jgi:hypothetical protein
MKNFIKTVLAASLLLAGVSLQAVTPETVAKLDTEREAQEKLRASESVPTIVITPPNEGKLPTTLEQFTQLPKDIQEQITLAINEGSTPFDAAKRLGQLRRVSHQMKNFIESPYSGKYLMQKIADRFPQAIRRLDPNGLLIAAFALKTPGSLAWVKEQIASGKIPRDDFNAELMMRLISSVGDAGHLSIANAIQLVGDPNYIINTRSNATLLNFAAAQNHIQMINDLLDAGANINFVSEYEESPGQIVRRTVLDLPNHLSKKTVDLLRSRGGKTAAELQQGR